MESLPTHEYQREHYSVSAFNQWLGEYGCPRKVYYNYCRGMPFVPGAAIATGQAVDSMVTCFQERAKGTSDADPESAFDQTYAQEREKLPNEELELADSLVPLYKQAVFFFIEDFMRNTLYAVDQDNRRIRGFRRWKPVAAQKYIELSVNGVSKKIIGFSDLLAEKDGKIQIIDYKTSKYDKTATQDYRMQLAVYALSVMKEMNLDYIPATQLLYFVAPFYRSNPSKKPPFYKIVDVSLTLDDLSHVINGFMLFDESVSRNYFPLNRSGKGCHQKFCSYFQLCHKETQMDLQSIRKAIA